MKRLWLAGLIAALAACGGDQGRRAPEALFVGMDVSGSFVKQGYYDTAFEFLANYIYARMNEKGGLQGLKNLFVGTIGGELSQETKSFYPIHDFQGKKPDQILADLKKWFPMSDRYTDYNIFFKQVSEIAQKRNLALVPITIVLLTDGIPDIAGQPEPGPHKARFDLIDTRPLEYMSRKVTLRVLYPSPMVASRWENFVARQRVRLWMVDDQVMAGWRAQYEPSADIDHQEKFWRWVNDNIDYRVRPTRVAKRRLTDDTDLVFETEKGVKAKERTSVSPAPKAPAAPPASGAKKKKK